MNQEDLIKEDYGGFFLTTGQSLQTRTYLDLSQKMLQQPNFSSEIIQKTLLDAETVCGVIQDPVGSCKFSARCFGAHLMTKKSTWCLACPTVTNSIRQQVLITRLGVFEHISKLSYLMKPLVWAFPDQCF